MRLIKRVITAATVGMLAMSCCGCDFIDALLGKDISVHQENADPNRYNVSAVADKVTELQDLWSKSGNDVQIKEILDYLLQAVDESYALHVHAEMEYYADWKNSTLSTHELNTDNDSSEVYEMVKWAVCNGYKKSLYSDLFKPYVDQNDQDYYLANSLSRVRDSARSTSASASEMMDSYYDTAYDKEQDPKDTNLECAKLYLEILNQYDTDDYLYSFYNRDYTVEQASGMYSKIVQELVPVYMELTDYLKNSKEYMLMALDGKNSEDPFQTLKRYAPKLSSSIGESADELVDHKRYYTGKGEDCYDNCFTACVPSEKSALMYIFLEDRYSDFLSVVHEFGHFNADWRDKTPVLNQINCTDLAEVQSQGMELLFTHLYPEIYPKHTKLMELISLYNIIDSVVAGFSVGEFEYRVMQHKEDYSASDVVNQFKEIHDKSDLGIDFYQIIHLFEQPGYYISYGVSALAALQIYEEMQEDFDGAVAKYERIASLSSVNGEHQLLNSLNEAGLSSVFDSAEFSRIIDVVKDKADQLTK